MLLSCERLNVPHLRKELARWAADHAIKPAARRMEAPFTSQGKSKAVGNGVPLPMGRAIAKAVRRTVYPETLELGA